MTLLVAAGRTASPLLIASLFLIASLAACATRAPAAPEAMLDRLLPAQALLLGEQHDAPEHQALQKAAVEHLARQGRLAAVVMEMADQGRQTDGLPRDATEARVREALGWTDDTGWPWPTYGPVVMAAVRAGVPVAGGNLPRSSMRAAMQDSSLDGVLDTAGLEQQKTGIREGHCGLLPESQIAPMTRIQLARDKAMAATLQQRARPGMTVLLIAGNGHVRQDIGVPRHLPAGFDHRVLVAQAGQAGAGLPADAVWPTPALPPQDHCAELRQRFGR
ncbi:ChaN family lipoprotein [Hydrogenophaga sp. R2]|uniref:ChaN family lipoprotein n=1 Tax=Hydrogenophaga sp. R2 TaxID=3132827 RepID=UPI003CF0F8E0